MCLWTLATHTMAASVSGKAGSPTGSAAEQSESSVAHALEREDASYEADTSGLQFTHEHMPGEFHEHVE